MLILARNPGKSIKIGDDIIITVTQTIQIFKENIQLMIISK